MNALWSRLSDLKKQVNQRDGSVEVLDQYKEILDNQKLIDELLQHKGFKVVLEALKIHFMKSLHEKIEDDPELNAYKKLFEQLIGSERAAKEINEELKQLVND